MKPRLPTRTLIEDGRTLFIVTSGELIDYAKEYADWRESDECFIERDMLRDTSPDPSNDAVVDQLMGMFGMKK